jgi:cell division protein FtsX
MAEEYVVSLAAEEEPESGSTMGALGVIWYELSGGIGPWGALRPLVAVAISLVPFLFLGQHFNRQHRKAFGYFLIQLPLILSVVMWPILYVWSIADSWWVSSRIIAKAESS